MIGRVALLAVAAVAAPSRTEVATVDDWTGAPIVLRQYERARMAQSPDGSMVLSYWNNTFSNSLGRLVLTAGGDSPLHLDAPALAIAPTILVRNWHSDAVKITNLSANASTSILLEAYGPGMPGRTSKPLGCDTATPVALGDALSAAATGGPMTLVFRAPSGRLSLFVLIGGPPDASGNNAYVFGLNVPPSKTPPAGYTRTVPGNALTYAFDWSTYLFIAYFGAGSVATQSVGAPAPTVTLHGC